MAGAQFGLSEILESLCKVTSDLNPVQTNKNGEEVPGKATQIHIKTALETLKACVVNLTQFLQKDQEKQAENAQKDQEKQSEDAQKLREQDDEIDHLKQKSLKGRIIITSSKDGKPSPIKTLEQIKHERSSLPSHVVTLAHDKYGVTLTEDDIANCHHTSKGDIIVSFWKNRKPSAFQNLVTAIKSSNGSDVNLYFNFMLTQRRGKLLFEIRKLKKAKRIFKFYSDEEGSISIKKNKEDKKNKKVTDFYENKKLKTWTVEDLLAEFPHES